MNIGRWLKIEKGLFIYLCNKKKMDYVEAYSKNYTLFWTAQYIAKICNLRR